LKLERVIFNKFGFEVLFVIDSKIFIRDYLVVYIELSRSPYGSSETLMVEIFFEIKKQKSN